VEKRILVAFEGRELSSEAIAYSRELAQRMNGELVLLLVRSRDEEDRRDGDAAGRLRRVARELSASGLPTSVEVRVGDPRSEFLKFVVTQPSFLAVVWGGAEEALATTSRRPAHWISLVGEELGCPLVSMHRKGAAGTESLQRRRGR
jgi:nucleotide-binding universal stress UspA family protein